MSAELLGSDFKKLVNAVVRFPSIGSFAGSEMINLRVEGGKARARTFGIVLSGANVRASGELPLVAVEDRPVVQFANNCPDMEMVNITIEDKRIFFRYRNRELTNPYVKGQRHILNVPKLGTLKLGREIADRLSYLSYLAFTDQSRPELNCVMLTGGLAMASSHKALAVVTCSLAGKRTPLPLALVQGLKVGDRILVGEEDTVLSSGIGYYVAPTPVKAKTEFPIALIMSIHKAEHEVVATCSGPRLSRALTECEACLGALTRTESTVVFRVKEKRLELSADNGTAKFRAAMKLRSWQKDMVFRAPMDQVVKAAPLLTEETQMTVAKHGELILKFKDGWVMFPPWKKEKK